MFFIEFARRQRHWSQKQLGDITRIHQSFISMIELGRGIPTADQAARLARELGLPPEMLLKTVATADVAVDEAQADVRG